MTAVQTRRALVALLALVASFALLLTSSVPAWADDTKHTRIGGDNRYSTSAKVSSTYYSAGVNRVFIASGVDYPDALSGGPVAAMGKGSPVLLTAKDSIPKATAKELKRLKPKEIVVLGGTAAVSAATAADLAQHTSGKVIRVAGDNRYSTSASISEKFFKAGVDTVYIASGADYPDALSAVPVAGHEGAPILLTQKKNLPNAVVTELKRLRPANIVVLGGTGAVTGSIVKKLKTFTSGSVTRLAGDNRYSTAVAVASHAFRTGADTVFLATGESYPDALTGGPIAARLGAPVILVKKDQIPGVVLTELKRLGAKKIVILGAKGAITNRVATAAANAKPGSTPKPPTTPSKKQFPSFKTRTFTGTGDDVLTKINLKQAAVIEFTCSTCTSNVIVETDSTSWHDGLLINEIGSYSGTLVTGMDEGKISRIIITTDAKWTLKIADLNSLPVAKSKISGTGDSAFVYTSKSKAARFTHNGSSNFIVYSHGERLRLAVNEIGKYSGTVPVSAGVITVNADGKWTFAKK